jgi:hypothetical protein
MERTRGHRLFKEKACALFCREIKLCEGFLLLSGRESKGCARDFNEEPLTQFSSILIMKRVGMKRALMPDGMRFGTIWYVERSR